VESKEPNTQAVAAALSQPQAAVAAHRQEAHHQVEEEVLLLQLHLVHLKMFLLGAVNIQRNMETGNSHVKMLITKKENSLTLLVVGQVGGKVVLVAMF
jgi:hypothetical protein